MENTVDAASVGPKNPPERGLASVVIIHQEANQLDLGVVQLHTRSSLASGPSSVADRVLHVGLMGVPADIGKAVVGRIGIGIMAPVHPIWPWPDESFEDKAVDSPEDLPPIPEEARPWVTPAIGSRVQDNPLPSRVLAVHSTRSNPSHVGYLVAVETFDVPEILPIKRVHSPLRILVNRFELCASHYTHLVKKACGCSRMDLKRSMREAKCPLSLWPEDEP